MIFCPGKKDAVTENENYICPFYHAKLIYCVCASFVKMHQRRCDHWLASSQKQTVSVSNFKHCQQIL